nr:hypothetical protein [Tanacetum cinerariifolium]
MHKVWVLVDLPHGKRAIGHTQEEGIDYKEVFAPVARIEAIRLFLAYASFMGFMVYQIDVKIAFLYRTIEEEVYVCQPSGFEDPNYPDKVYKMVKKKDGIFISQDKYVAEILRKFRLTDGKLASTPIDTEKPLLKDPDGEDVDVHTYRSMIGSLMYLTSSRTDIMFAVNDVTRLQALVDKKNVIITKATIRDALRLDDAEGIECLPNEDIFIELARMVYEKPFTKLTFYKAFFSSKWKFLIHTILQCRKFNFSKYIFDSLVRNVDSSTKFYTYPRFLQLMIRKQVGDLSSHTTKYSSPSLTQKVFANMRRVGKRFSKVETPLFEGIIVEQPVGKGVDEVHDEGVPAAGVAAESDVSTADDDKIAHALEITKLKQRVKKLERMNKASKLKRLRRVGTVQRIKTSDDTVMDDVSKQGRMIADMDVDVDVTLKDVASDAKDGPAIKMEENDELKPVELQEVVEVVTTAKLITEVVTTASTTITAAAPQLTIAAAPTLTTAPSTARRRKRVVIRDIEESATPSTIIHFEAKSKDKGKGILRKQKKDNDVKRYQAFKRKPQTEAQARKNMMIYLRNTNEQMDEEDSRVLKRLSKSQDDKVAKKQKLDEEVEELKRHLQIVPNNKDDVYTEATPLGLKVLVVDYEIYTENNKLYYKIKRADGLHQLYLSFLSMLRNFDREDLEVLWQLVKERFASTKPKNFSDDFLLTTLEAMFDKPDIQA